MAKQLLPEAEQYAKQNNLRQIWRKFVRVMACVVVFCTTYALILPAITMEKDLICGMEEHVHAENCYAQVTTVQRRELTCTYESLGVHVHGAECADAEGNLTCGKSDYVLHAHDDSCTDACTLPEISGHVHADGCYQAVTAEPELVCGLEETEDHTHSDACWQIPETEPELVCGRAETILHSHTEACYDAEDVLTCALPVLEQHIHGEVCFTVTVEAADTQSLTCGLEESETHTHTDRCYGTWELVCEMAEHTHTDKCYPAADAMAETVPGETDPETGLTEAEQAAVDHVISLIEAMPSADEIDAKIEEFEAAEDYEGEEAWLTEAYQQVAYAYNQYSALSEAQKSQVTNADKLLELEYIWSVTPLASYAFLPVKQINSYDNSTDTVLVHGGTVGTMTGGGMDFAWWTAVVIEEGTDGQLYVSEVYPAGTGIDKSNCQAKTDNGIVVLVYNATPIAPAIGDPVVVGFSYHLNTGYSEAGFGAVEIGKSSKPVKDNSSQLTIVEGADTSELIEVNLYNYTSNINDLYHGNTKYPGYQQDYGTTSLTATDTALGRYDLNFGNNITEDLDAGYTTVTERDGTTINGTVGTYNDVDYGYANLPLEGTMYKTLLEGYPAMADTTSLSYLFSNNDYATKQNKVSINGLFKYNSTTGAYTFNSRENHAQFNSANDTFTLYEQLISSNFMMYPFGNFLPFNDITKQSAQASTIDRAYLLEIAQSAAFRYNQGAGNKYSAYTKLNEVDPYWKLNEQLNLFIALMDKTYGTDWDAYDAVNMYFDKNGLPMEFSETFPVLPSGKPLMDYIYSIDFDEATNFYFGMEMKMRFRQPRNGLTGLTGKDPMIFYFTGDDDVWVYVDDVLFLDLSGIHRHVGGEIDFVDGVIRYYPLEVAAGDVPQAPYKTMTFEEAFRAAYAEGSAELAKALDGLNEKGTFDDYTVHSFNFYYMERGAGSGVCRMNFNFPLLKQNSLSVEKDLLAEEDIELLGNPDFMFQILDVDPDGNKTENSFFKEYDPVGYDWAYTLYDTDGSLIQEVVVTDRNSQGTVNRLEVYNYEGDEPVLVRIEEEKMNDAGKIETIITNIEGQKVYTINADGILTLKAGQRAEFTGIPEDWGRYYVRELLDPVISELYGQITVSGTAANRETVTVGGVEFEGAESPIMDMGDGSSTFTFQNKITTSKLGQLEISKQIDQGDYTGELPGTNFTFAVTLDGQLLPGGTQYTVLDSSGNTEETRTVGSDGCVTIARDQTARIGNILAGAAFRVTEQEASAKGYTVSYRVDDSGTTTTDHADGTIGVSSAVKVTVTNQISSAKLSIPVNKRFALHDGGEHTYTFHLTQVADAQGTEIPGAPAQEKTVTFNTEAHTFDFELSYSSHEFDSLPATRYYRITEAEAADSVKNSQAFIAQVEIDRDGEGIAAKLVKMWVRSGDVYVEHSTDSADFVNTLVGDLSLEKIVKGSSTTQGFKFTITLESGESGVDLTGMEFPIIGKNADGSEFRATMGESFSFTIYAAENLTISGIPIGVKWTITETDSGGLIPSYQVGTVSYDGATAEGTIILGDTSVRFTNTQTYVLPETGGPGTICYTMAGLMLMLCSAAYLLYRFKKRGREVV